MPVSIPLGKMPPARLLIVGLVAASLLGFFGWLVLGRAGQPDRVLFGGLAPADIAPMTQVLDSAGIRYRMTQDGGSILVLDEDLGRARILVAGQGLPQQGPAGYELLDRGQSLGSTQFRDEVTYLRAIEGELSRTIAALAGVRSAKVHIVMAKREPFSREWTPPSASVLLTLSAPEILGREQVAAVRHLVSSAVPRLKADSVSIIDSAGNLLATSDTDGNAELDRAEQRRIAFEERIAHAIEQQLTPIVGVGRVRAKVSAELDLSTRRSVEESFDPLGQVPRSEQSEVDRERGSETEPNVSVEQDLPENKDKKQQSPSSTNERDRNKTTKNFEIGKTTREQMTQAGEVKRLSISIAVDGICEPGEGGKPVCRPRSAEELGQIERLARATSGFSSERGDTFEIASMPFAGLEPAAAEAPAPPEPEMLPGGLVLWGSIAGAAALLGGLATFLLLRRRRRRVAEETAAIAAEEAQVAEAAAQLEDASQQPPLLEGPEGAALVPADDTEAMVDLGRNVQGHVRRASIERVQALIDESPDESVTFLRSWLNEKREAR